MVLVLVRAIALDADPPSWLSWSAALYTDEGFYTLDARHHAVFGTPAPGDFHDRLLSPLLSLLQQWVFMGCGAGFLPARLIGAAFGLLTLGAFWLGLRRAYGERVADSGALLLGLAPPFVLYNRLALQETPTVFWLTLAFCLWAAGGRGTVLPLLTGVSAAAAVLFKSLAMLALPAFAVVRPEEGSRKPVLAGLGIVFALYGIFWYLPHQAELTRMAAYYRTHQLQPHSLTSLGLNIRRGFWGGERGVFPYLLALMPVPFLLAVWGVARRETAADRVLVTWLACGLLFCLLSSYAPSRYYVLFLPPLAALAARGLRVLPRAAQGVALALFIVSSVAWLVHAWTGRTYALRDADRKMARTLPSGSVVIGDMAPALCLDTRFAAVPVQPGLSNDDRPVERLHADCVAVVRAPVWQQWWRTRYPDIVQPSHHLMAFSYGGRRNFVVDVYRVLPAPKEPVHERGRR